LKFEKSDFELQWGIKGPSSPLIVPPEANLLLAGPGEYDSCDGFSYAVLETDINISSLRGCFARQLVEGNWSCKEEATKDDTYASRWGYQDEGGKNKTFLLLIAELSGAPERRLAFLEVEDNSCQVDSACACVSSEEYDSEFNNDTCNESEILEVAERLRSCKIRAGGMYRGGEEKQLLPGKIPSGLSDDLPISERARVIGSIFPEAGSNSSESTRILLYTDERPEEVLDFYKASLPARGWINKYPGEHSSYGFVDNKSTASNDRYLPQRNKHLVVWTNAKGINATEINLELYSICNEMPVIEDLCKIVEPIDLALSNDQSEGGYEYLVRLGGPDPSFCFNNDFTGFKTDLNSSDLARIYANRLYMANWTLGGSGGDDTLSWYAISLPGDGGLNWSGLLYSLKTNSTENYQLVSIWAKPVMSKPAQPKTSLESSGFAKSSTMDRSSLQRFANWALRGRVVCGRMPKGMSFYPKLPDGARVIGSLVDDHTFAILLDTPKSPGEVLQFYREEMSKANWSEVEEDFRGFAPPFNTPSFAIAPKAYQ
jgi:hypothetical protein